MTVNQARAWNILMFGAPKFFVPRPPPTVLFPGHAAGRVSMTMRRSGRRWPGWSISIVSTRGICASASRAVDVCSGNFTYFDTTTHRIAVEHVVASGSLPPAFPSTEVDGDHYWDGGLVTNTPLQWVLDNRPRRDTLAFQVDLWSARGQLPKDLVDVEVRHKEIVYSSRTRAATDHYKTAQKMRNALATLLKKLPRRTVRRRRGKNP